MHASADSAPKLLRQPLVTAPGDVDMNEKRSGRGMQAGRQGGVVWRFPGRCEQSLDGHVPWWLR